MDTETEEDFTDCSTFSVIIENKVLCEAGDFVEAFCLYISAYYVFNISYPEQLYKTMVFIEKLILKLHDNTSKCKKLKGIEKQVINIIAKINNVIVSNKPSAAKKAKKRQ